MKNFNIKTDKWYLLTLAEMAVADFYNNYRKKHNLPLTDFCKFKSLLGYELTSKEVAEIVHKEALEIEDLLSKPVKDIQSTMYNIAETMYIPA